MLVYVTYWDWKLMRPVLEYLCCARLLRKTADCIFDALKNICSVLGLDMKNKLETFCADGDNTMQGFRKRLTGCLRRHCDFVLSMHYIAHKQVLAVKDVADVYASLMSLDSVLKAVYQRSNRPNRSMSLFWSCLLRLMSSQLLHFPCLFRLAGSVGLYVSNVTEALTPTARGKGASVRGTGNEPSGADETPDSHRQRKRIKVEKPTAHGPGAGRVVAAPNAAT
jgi:hypothetical protein